MNLSYIGGRAKCRVLNCTIFFLFSELNRVINFSLGGIFGLEKNYSLRMSSHWFWYQNNYWWYLCRFVLVGFEIVRKKNIYSVDFMHASSFVGVCVQTTYDLTRITNGIVVNCTHFRTFFFLLLTFRLAPAILDHVAAASPNVISFKNKVPKLVQFTAILFIIGYTNNTFSRRTNSYYFTRDSTWLFPYSQMSIPRNAEIHNTPICQRKLYLLTICGIISGIRYDKGLSINI